MRLFKRARQRKAIKEKPRPKYAMIHQKVLTGSPRDIEASANILMEFEADERKLQIPRKHVAVAVETLTKIGLDKDINIAVLG